MILLPGCSCCATPKRYTCRDGACVEDPAGEYDEPTCGGNCECQCPDWCLYQIEVLSPVSWGPKPIKPCEPDGSMTLYQEFPEGLYAPCEDAETCCGSVTEPNLALDNLTTTVIDQAYARFNYKSTFGAGGDIEVRLLCDNNENGKYIYADISYRLDVPGDDGLIPRVPTRTLLKTAQVPLDSQCETRTNITCDAPSETVYSKLVLTTPLEFTVDASSAGPGDWDESTDTPVGDQSRVTPCFDHLVQNFSATFRITARESCEPLPPPCTVLVDGVRVPISSFDPYEVVSATWEGLSAPGSDRVILDGELVYDFGPATFDSLDVRTTAGCDGSGQNRDSKSVLIAGGSGIVNACLGPSDTNAHVPLGSQTIDDMTCRLFGGISTVKQREFCLSGGVQGGDNSYEETYWKWECLVVNGVPGAVTVTAVRGARYVGTDPVECAVTLDPPVVTLTFAP